MSDMPEAKKIRLLLVDDDPFFGRISETGSRQARNLRDHSRLAEQPRASRRPEIRWSNRRLRSGDITGPELGFQLEKILGNIPIILVSAKQRVEVQGKEWPPCIKGFVQKELGHAAILASILGACEARDRSAAPNRQAK